MIRLVTEPQLSQPAQVGASGEFPMREAAIRAHVDVGLDFASWERYYGENGYIVNTPETYMMFGDDHYRGRDAWLVWWYCTTREDAILHALEWMPYWRPEVCWFRPYKNHKDMRYYSTDRLLGLKP